MCLGTVFVKNGQKTTEMEKKELHFEFQKVFLLLRIKVFYCTWIHWDGDEDGMVYSIKLQASNQSPI